MKVPFIELVSLLGDKELVENVLMKFNETYMWVSLMKQGDDGKTTFKGRLLYSGRECTIVCKDRSEYSVVGNEPRIDHFFTWLKKLEKYEWVIRKDGIFIREMNHEKWLLIPYDQTKRLTEQTEYAMSQFNSFIRKNQ